MDFSKIRTFKILTFDEIIDAIPQIAKKQINKNNENEGNINFRKSTIFVKNEINNMKANIEE